MTPLALLHQIDATATALGVGRSKIYELIAAGELETVHIGRRSLVTDESLTAFVDRLRAAAKEAVA